MKYVKPSRGNIWIQRTNEEPFDLLGFSATIQNVNRVTMALILDGSELEQSYVSIKYTFRRFLHCKMFSALYVYVVVKTLEAVN